MRKSAGEKNLKNELTLLIHGVPGALFYEEIKSKLKQGYRVNAIVTEGRPNLEGARLVSKTLVQYGLKPVMISDNMVGHCLWKGGIDFCALFYTRLGSWGIECKIGSLIVAFCAREHQTPVYCYPSGQDIPPEGKPADIFYFNGFKVSPDGVKAYVPLVETIPWDYVTILHTRRGHAISSFAEYEYEQ